MCKVLFWSYQNPTCWLFIASFPFYGELVRDPLRRVLIRTKVQVALHALYIKDWL
jgi:hypothetical protein